MRDARTNPPVLPLLCRSLADLSPGVSTLSVTYTLRSGRDNDRTGKRKDEDEIEKVSIVIFALIIRNRGVLN